LGNFLSRPVKIGSHVWSVGTNVANVYYPWNAFFKDPNVKRRLEGFRHVRGHLKIRAVITGNPFLFGRILLSYEPYGTKSVFEVTNPLQKVYKTVHSQHPHLYLDATSSEGGEMTLPFFTPYNWFDLTNLDAFLSMGTLRTANMTPLRHANSSTGSVNIELYAWMEDAEICTPTNANYESVEFQGEFSQSPISKPASAVAKAAGLLSRIPLLRPYALATESAASFVSGVASAFGYSRPAIVDNVSLYKSVPAGELSTMNTHEPLQRLGADVKGQLCVDPRTVGLDGIDEMAIPYVCSREAYVADMVWEETDLAESPLGSFDISPTFLTLDTTTTPVINAIPPMTGIAQLFKYWRGTIIVRISVVASSMHRGKLLVQYDPLGNLAGATTNDVYTRIIDIAETRDFEIPIKWNATTPWLKTRPPSWGVSSQLGYNETGLGSLNSDDLLHTNGILSIKVLNPLSSPDPDLGNSVSILGFVRAGDDIEFAMPYGGPRMDVTYRSSNPAIEPQGNMADEDEAIELATTSVDPMGTSDIPVADHSTKVFMGEAVPSLRTLLKRYDYKIGTSLAGATNILVRSNVATNITPTVQEFLMNAFVGWRGSIRYKIFHPGNTVVFARKYLGDPSSSLKNIFDGATVQPDVTNLELPFYSGRRFSLTRTSPYWTSDTDTDPYEPNRAGLSSISLTGSITTAHVTSSVGEDFSLFFFLGFPPLYLKN